MKSVQLNETRKTEIIEETVPAIGPKQILIKTRFAGICGSDVHAFEGRHPFRRPPVVLGHEISGTIEQFGAEVRGFEVGDPVTVMPYKSCGTCLPCRKGQPNVCANKIVPGVKGWGGTFAEYFVSYPDITFKLKSSEELIVGALAEPLAVGVHSAKRGGVSEGDEVLILGAGSIGILTAVAASSAGCKRPVITDVIDFNLEMAEHVAGAKGVNAREKTFEKDLLGDYPDGFDVVIMCSGVTSNFGEAFRLVRRGGTIVLTGLYMKSVEIDPVDITLREINFLGSQIYLPNDFNTALKIIGSGRYPLKDLITDTVSFAETQTALEQITSGKSNNVKVLIEP